jgi:hypothetical protein
VNGEQYNRNVRRKLNGASFMSRPTSVRVEIGVPYIGKIEGTWEPDESEQRAAWELYVELITRVAVVKLQPETGLLRESLSSIHSLFGITRALLRGYGPGVARPKGQTALSFGYLAVIILNVVLRPVLAKWHPLLLDYESTKPVSVSAVEHERRWMYFGELRQTLEQTHSVLLEYANVLAEVADVPLLLYSHENE